MKLPTQSSPIDRNSRYSSDIKTSTETINICEITSSVAQSYPVAASPAPPAPTAASPTPVSQELPQLIDAKKQSSLESRITTMRNLAIKVAEQALVKNVYKNSKCTPACKNTLCQSIKCTIS